MKPFQPIGHFDEATGLWRLDRQWICRLATGNMILVVEPGMLSDGASIPFWIQPLVGPRYGAKTFASAFAHDCLYAAELVSRKQADDEFHRLLREFGAYRVTATAYYRAVRVFGGIVYRRHTLASVSEARRFCRLAHCVAPEI
jgi:hypothetical protein